MKNVRVKTLLVAAACMATAGVVNAATDGRVIPNGKVSFQKNGQIVSSFTDQVPVDENALIVCDGNCMVKLAGLSLSAADQSVFAVKQDGETYNLYVKSGRVDFIVNDTEKQMAFYMPNGRYVKTEGFIAPAATTSSVKGFMGVSDTLAEIGVNQGGIMLATADGHQLVNSGSSYQVAQADVDVPAAPAVAVTPPTPVSTSVFENLGEPVLVGGTVAAIVTTAVIVENSTDDDETLVTTPAAAPAAAPVESKPAVKKATPRPVPSING